MTQQEETHKTTMPMDETLPANELPPRRKSRLWIYVLLIVFAVLSLITYALYSSALGYTGYSRVKSYLSDAKRIYEAALHWQEEGAYPLQSHIRQLGEDASEGSFGDFLREYGVSEKSGWYAIECDARGNVLCVWYSRREITKDEVYPIPWEETLEELKTPFHAKQAVVCYPQEGGTPIDEEIY